MKNCVNCGEEFKGLSPGALACRKYCASCMAGRRKRQQKEYIKRTKYNLMYAKKYYHWKNKVRPEDKIRTCLSCERSFKSTGPGNRICGPCRLKEEMRSIAPHRVHVGQGIVSRE